MWIKSDTYPVMDGEPQLGNMVETELMGKEEGLEILIAYMEDQQEVPTTFTAIDDFTCEDIELQTKDYLSTSQIDMLNEMFTETDGWTEEQLEYLINYRRELDEHTSRCSDENSEAV